ncbi:MAG: 2-dehydro-3-deoxyphosphooctonate aldolase [marine bacterium B5-7]|nr:MAG: 2-dehydro-3-deoxyphosphooctonate aldolase [marine bacterium B5-7]
MIKQVIVGDDKVNKVRIGEGERLCLLAGPCAIESETHAIYMAEQIAEIAEKVGVSLIYKSCYDKDCRSSPDSYHGCGIDSGLEILQKVRDQVGVPVVTDISSAEWVEATASVVDMLQIPAYLCRQTHLLRACAKTKKPLHLKKGQFMNPRNMKNSLAKIYREDNHQVVLCDRGTFFGYEDLVNDMRSLMIMREFGIPVSYDATHSIQQPTGSGSVSQGLREFIPGLVRAACGVGVDAIFMEVHDNPSRALSDPATQLDIRFLESILRQAVDITRIVRETVVANPTEGLS